MVLRQEKVQGDPPGYTGSTCSAQPGRGKSKGNLVDGETHGTPDCALQISLLSLLS